VTRLAIRLLGPFEVTLDGEPITQFETLKTRALLAYLAAEVGSPHRREALAEMLWPDRPEGAARANLRHTLRSLRLAIGDHEAEPPFLITTRETVALNPDVDTWADVRDFAGSLSGLERMENPDPEALEKALASYREPFLEDLSVPDSALFEEWRILKREQLQRQVLDLLSRLVTGYERQGEYQRALAHAWRKVDLEPWDETARRQVMRLLARSGRSAEALGQYEACRKVLADELGVEPETETVQLYEQIQRGELGPETTVRAGPPVPVWNLPAAPTPFFGRTDELSDLEEGLADPDTRLVTISGPGGSGKTRLALEVGARFAARDRQAQSDQSPLSFPHGIIFVPLAAIDTVEGLVSAMAEALGLHLLGGRDQLLEFLRRKQILLILDNLEHLLDGAGFLAKILRTAPGVHILTTSRERLRLHSEHVLPIGGLSYPDHILKASSPKAADPGLCVAAYPAFHLFVDSARRVQPRFAVTPGDLPLLLDICRHVDGLPLALELAASWADALSVRDILAEAQQSLSFLQAEWHDVPERHRSMRAVFDVSWRRLSGPERDVFCRLSVFRGGFSQKAASQVIGPEASPRTLAALVRKSFLQCDHPRDRYQVHELLRQYGALHLAEEPEQEAEAFDRHSRYFCAWMQSVGADLRNRRQNSAQAQLGADLDNARAACLLAAAQGRADRINQAVHALGWYYHLRGVPGAGEATFSALVERLGTEMDRPCGADRSVHLATARLCLWRSQFAGLMGDSVQSDRIARESLAILDSPALADEDTRAERATAWMRLGYAMRDTDPEKARIRFRLSQQLYEEVGDPLSISDALVGLGRAARNIRDFEAAERAVAEALRLRQEVGDGVGAAEATSILGHIALWQGAFDRAVRLLRQGLTKHFWSNYYLSHALLLAGRLEEARAEAEATMVVYSDPGQPRELAYSMGILGQCHLHLGYYEAARVSAQEGLYVAEGVGFPRGAGMGLGLLGAIALADANHDEAHTRCEASLAVWQQSSGHPSEFEGELACLALAAAGMGHRAEAREHLRAQLAWAQESQMLMPGLFGLVAAARLLADAGQIERAVELYALASRYPSVANSRWFEDVVGQQIADVAAALPAARVAVLQELGQARDLKATAAELLAELRT
jgi:predicted ATPase/DNA-binding SARP family transcriptional activator